MRKARAIPDTIQNPATPPQGPAPVFAHPPTIAIGGVGGSGTRLVAQIFEKMGVFMGHDLNGSHDNIWFTLLFRRKEVLEIGSVEFAHRFAIFASAMIGSRPFEPDIEYYLSGLVASLPAPRLDVAQQRMKSLLEKREPHSSHRFWGWKEPNTHIVLERLLQLQPDLKYIHVMRNGLDMAYSRNQNQPRFWNAAHNQQRIKVSPAESLHFWCRTHERLLELSEAYPGRVKLVRFEDICDHPNEKIAQMAQHSGLSPTKADIAKLATLVQRPESIGRHRNHDLSCFAPTDLRFVQQMGYDSAEGF